MELLLYAVAVQYSATSVEREIWKTKVVSVYEHLTAANIREWIYEQTASALVSFRTFVESIICNLAYFNALLSDKTVLSCECDNDSCCDSGDTLCESDDGNDYTELSIGSLLDKRAGSRPFDITFSGGSTIHYTSLAVGGFVISVSGQPVLC